MLKNEIKEKVILNNKKITELLKENEKLLKEEGFIPPKENYAVDYVERIHVPSGYVRTSGEFFEKYHLGNIVRSFNTRNNISYSLQLLDYYNFLLNRFYIWGSIRTMLYKQDIINIVSILEALITETTENILCCCDKCIKISKCKNRINKHEQGNMKKAISFLCNRGILDFSEKEIERIKYIYDLRNRIHIRLATENEFLNNSFCQETHNELILILIRTAERLNTYAVPMYDKCVMYESVKI